MKHVSIVQMTWKKTKSISVTFQVTEMEREEILCDECYQEWLQGIKG